MGKKKVIRYGSVYRDKEKDIVIITDIKDTRKEALQAARKIDTYGGVAKVEYIEESVKNQWFVKGHEVTNEGNKPINFKIETVKNPLVKDGVKITGCLTDEGIRAYAETYEPSDVEGCISRLTNANGKTMFYTQARSPQIF